MPRGLAPSASATRVDGPAATFEIHVMTTSNTPLRSVASRSALTGPRFEDTLAAPKGPCRGWRQSVGGLDALEHFTTMASSPLVDAVLAEDMTAS